MAMNHSQKKRLENVWEALKHDKIAIFSIIFLALILILSLLAPVLPLEPNKTDVAHMLEAPSSAHIFGTDEVGRDYPTGREDGSGSAVSVFSLRRLESWG